MLASTLSLGLVLFSGALQQNPGPKITPFEGAVSLSLTAGNDTKLIYDYGFTVDTVVAMPNGLGEQAMAVETQMQYTYEFGALDVINDTMPIRITTLIKKYTAGGVSAMNGRKNVQFIRNGLVDRQSRIRDLKLEKSADSVGRLGAMSTQNTIWLQFADHPVSVGDTWTSEIIPNPFLNPKLGYYTVKLLGESEVDGHQCYALGFTGTIYVDGDLTPFLEADDKSKGMQMLKLMGTTDVTGTEFVDKTSGQMVLSIVKSKDQQKVRTSEDIEITTVGKSIGTMRLRKN